MILEKKEISGVIYAKYDSSNVLASEYYPNSDLIITFKGGGRYKYTGVKKTDYTRFEIAESQGSVLNTHIKIYPFEKMDKMDTTLLAESIKDLKAKEKEIIFNEKLKAMLDSMNLVLEEAKTSTYIRTLNLIAVKTAIDSYINETPNN